MRSRQDVLQNAVAVVGQCARIADPRDLLELWRAACICILSEIQHRQVTYFLHLLGAHVAP